jgi:hypothetical protein
MDSDRPGTDHGIVTRPRRLLAAALALAALLTGAARPAPAAADDPLFVEWSSLLPGLTSGYDPTSENLCKRGHTACVDAVVREMARRFDPLASACHHNAVFAMTYLRTTEEYRRTIEDPTFFSDTSFVNHEDAVFAEYYFRAYDDWAKGRRDAVPAAWLVAFDAAQGRQVSGSGNLLLGMSAHINRDLPYVLAGIGLVRPDESSRKPDHDKVNQFLNRVTQPVIAEAAARFDPTMDDSNMPGTFDETATLQMVVAWRETAWRNAERLASARTDAERAEVARSIEDYSLGVAQSIRASTAYGPLSAGPGPRDAWCAEHHDDQGPYL